MTVCGNVSYQTVPALRFSSCLIAFNIKPEGGINTKYVIVIVTEPVCYVSTLNIKYLYSSINLQIKHFIFFSYFLKIVDPLCRTDQVNASRSEQ